MNSRERNNIKILLLDARKSYEQSEKKLKKALDYIQIRYPEINMHDIETNAENSSNLEQSICCFCHYGEYSSYGIIKDLEEHLNR